MIRWLPILLLLTASAFAQPFTANDPAFLQSTSPLRVGLAGYWRLEESSGTRYDRSPNGNHLTSNNSVGQAAGKVGNCATFASASSQSLSIVNNNTLHFTNAMTVACWWKFTTTNTTQSAVGKWNGTTLWEYFLAMNSANGLMSFSVSTNGTTETGVAASTFGKVTTGTWYFLVGVFDGANVKVSVNGGAFDSVACANPIKSGTADFRIGNVNYIATNFYCNGAVDEVGLWNRVLTSAEIAQLYRSGGGVTWPRFQSYAPPSTNETINDLPSFGFAFLDFAD